MRYWNKLLRSYAVEAVARPSCGRRRRLAMHANSCGDWTGTRRRNPSPALPLAGNQRGRLSQIELDAAAAEADDVAPAGGAADELSDVRGRQEGEELRLVAELAVVKAASSRRTPYWAGADAERCCAPTKTN